MLSLAREGHAIGDNIGEAAGDGGIMRVGKRARLGRGKDAQEVVGPGARTLEEQEEGDLRVGHRRDGVQQTVMGDAFGAQSRFDILWVANGGCLGPSTLARMAGVSTPPSKWALPAPQVGGCGHVWVLHQLRSKSVFFRDVS